MFVEIDHPKAGKLKMTGNQIKLTNHKIDTFTHAPILGEHTVEILQKELGFTKEEIDKLIEEKVL